MKYFTLDSLDVREVFWDAHPKRVLQGATGVPSDSDLSVIQTPWLSYLPACYVFMIGGISAVETFEKVISYYLVNYVYFSPLWHTGIPRATDYVPRTVRTRVCWTRWDSCGENKGAAFTIYNSSINRIPAGSIYHCTNNVMGKRTTLTSVAALAVLFCQQIRTCWQ